jgi:hypothetical protein
MTTLHPTPEERAANARSLYEVLNRRSTINRTSLDHIIADALRAERRAALQWVLDLYGYDFPCTQYSSPPPQCSHTSWAQCLRNAIEAEMKE